jgi:hypothetical protein
LGKRHPLTGNDHHRFGGPERVDRGGKGIYPGRGFGRHGLFSRNRFQEPSESFLGVARQQELSAFFIEWVFTARIPDPPVVDFVGICPLQRSGQKIARGLLLSFLFFLSIF